MAWFKRKEKGITTATEDKMDVPKVFGISLLQEKLLMLMSWNQSLCESRRWFSC
jgi:hypothetical protein